MKKLQQTMQLECLSKSTVKSYTYHISKFIRYYGEKPRQENIITHLLFLKRQGYSATSLSVARASLIYYFEKALEIPITIKIDKPKRPKCLPKPVERETIVKLINNTKNLKHRIVIELLYSSGIRLAEIVRLKWEDIDFLNKTVRINQGKGNKDRISIISNVVIQHLLDYNSQRQNNQSPYIFDSMARPNTHISKKTVQMILKNVCNKLNIPVVSPHQLRHSFATHSLENGTDIRHIQELLGHSSPKTTMIYTKVTKQNLSKLQSPLDSLDLTIQKNVKGNNNCIERAVISNIGYNS